MLAVDSNMEHKVKQQRGYDAYDSYNGSPDRQSGPKKSKKLKVYNNGDKYNAGKSYVLSDRSKPNFDIFLDELTGHMKPVFSCGRRLYSARGRGLVRHVDELEDGKAYVLAANEPFKPCKYTEIPPQKPPILLSKGRYRKIDINRPVIPVIHAPNYRNMQGRAVAEGSQQQGLQLKVFNFHKYADAVHTISVRPKDKNNIEKIKRGISETLNIAEDMSICQFCKDAEPGSRYVELFDAEAVQRLAREGCLVVGSRKEIREAMRAARAKAMDQSRAQSRNEYLERGKERFKNNNVSPRGNVPHYNSNPFGAVPHDREKHNRSIDGKKKPLGQIKSGSKKSESPYSNPPSQDRRRKQYSNGSKQSRQIDYDEDKGGVYRAKGQDNSRGAKQVNETRDTRTERPIDQMEAEEVEEEEFPSKEKTTPIPPGTELNKKPSKEQKQDKDMKKQKQSEVKKGSKTNGNDKLYVSEIPPVVEEEPPKKGADKVDKVGTQAGKSGTTGAGSPVKADAPVRKERTEDKESQVAEDTFENYKDIVDDDEATPNELKTNNVSPSKPPMSTTPPDSSKGVGTQEKIGDDKNDRRQNDQWDDSFNQADHSNNQRQSTPVSKNESRVKDEQKELKAATTIQAGFRGYNARKDVKAKKQEKRQQEVMRQEEEMRKRADEEMRKNADDDKRMNQAATKIQAGFKGYQARRKVKGNRQVSENDKKRKKGQAAVKIQSSYRGYMTRKKYTHKKVQDQKVDINANENKTDNKKIEKETKAATSIQSSYRGYQVRKNMKAEKEKRKKNEQEKEESAKKIQASFKGYQTRKSLATKMEAEKALVEEKKDVARKNGAATRIQANYRGYSVRRKTQETKAEKQHSKQKQDEAATKIQAATRGYHARKTHKQNHNKEPQLPDSAPESNENHLNTAATKIQSAFRGYNTRKEIKSQVTSNFEISDLLVDDVDQLPESAVSRLTHRKGRTNVKKDTDLISNVQTAFRAYHFRKQNVSGHVEAKTASPNIDNVNVLASACRGYFTRKKYKSFTVEKKLSQILFSEPITETPRSQEPNYSIKSSNILLAAVRGYSVRKVTRSRIEAKSKVLAIHRADYFATLIQALCKGYVVRHDLKPLRSTSSISIQGPSSPKSLTPKRVSPVKSYWEDTNVKMYSDKTLWRAATTIQATYHMYNTRTNMHAWKLEQSIHTEQTPFESDEHEQAISTIQKYFSGYSSRMSNEIKQKNESGDERERPKSSESVSSVRSRKRDSSGRVKTARKREERMKSAVRCSTRMSESDSILNGDTNVSPIKSESSSKIVSPRNSDGEVEKEGESLIEVEDDAGELSSIEKNVNAVCQLQAAFWAYKLRREVSELMSGGAELIDIQKVDRAVSALRKDFRLRSAKVRRLGFERSRHASGNWWDKEEDSFDEKDGSAHVIKSAFSRYFDRRKSETESCHKENKPNFVYPEDDSNTAENDNLEKRIHIDANYKRFLERENAQKEKIKMKGTATIVMAMSGYLNHKREHKQTERDKSTKTIVDAMRNYKMRKSEHDNEIKMKKLEGVSILASALTGCKLREDANKKRSASLVVSAFQEYKARTARVKVKKEESIGILYSGLKGYRLRQDRKLAVRKVRSTTLIRSVFYNYWAYKTERNKKAKNTIQAAFTAHVNSKQLQAEKVKALRALNVKEKAREAAEQKKASKMVIQAAFVGYGMRTEAEKRRAQKLERRSAKSHKSQQSNKSLHVEMHSNILVHRATELQAAFAGYQVRRVFLSLSKMVKSDSNTSDNGQSRPLERMGSLSETDDFKLRHKSIAKLQAFNIQHRIQSAQIRKIESNSLKLKHASLPLIPIFMVRSKTGLTLPTVQTKPLGNKSYTLPNLFETKALPPIVSKIETFFKEKMAAGCIQASVRGYLARKDCNKKAMQRKSKGKIKSSEKRQKSAEKRPPSGRRPRSSKSSRVSFALALEEEQKVEKQEELSDSARNSTSSIKLEAERRKLLAGALKLKKETHEVKQTASSVKMQAEKLKEEKASLRNNSERETNSALCIQKTFRGYKVRKALKGDRLQKYEAQYEEWKYKRINAAIAIQSSWRGYVVRKDLKDREESLMEEIRSKSTQSEVSTLKTESPADLPELIVINIGRTKSEIERAEQRHANADMIQLVVRANRMRRKMQIKLARRRLTNNVAASKIQALYWGFMTRRLVKIDASATRLQTVIRAYWVRQKKYTELQEREIQKQKAASFLQAAYVGWKKRAEIEAEKAATSIKAGFKGFVVRETMCERKKVLDNRAADRLQCCVRGQRARLRAYNKKKAASLIVSAYRSYVQRETMRLYKEKVERERISANRINSSVRAIVTKKAFTKFRIDKARKRKAANNIQAAFRAMKCRVAFLNFLKLREESALKIQATYRGHRGRKIAKGRRHEKQMNESALKIQAMYRGYRGRKIAEDRRHAKQMNDDARYIIDMLFDRAFDYMENRADSADRIQASVSGHQRRQNVTTKLRVLADKRFKEKYVNGSTIQSMLRVHQGRIRNHKRRVLAAKNKAATKVQSCFHGMQTRKHYQKRRILAIKNTSASLIQRVYHNQQARNRLQAAKELRMQHAAAIKIQALYRGYSVRLDFEREHKMVANIRAPMLSPRTRSGRKLTIEVDEVLMRNAKAMILLHRKASELQGAFRGYLAREELKRRLIIKTHVTLKTPRNVVSSRSPSNDDKAAILIQKTFRGYSDRKAYNRLIKHKRKIWFAAACQIQASLRGFRVRMEERMKRKRVFKEGLKERMEKKREVADIIGYAYRGLASKRERKAERFEM